MSIISTTHHLIGVQGGGETVSGAVRYDIEQNLTPEEQDQARQNIGISALCQEYSGGANIDITDHVVSVTGKKLLQIDDNSLTATEGNNSITIAVQPTFVENITNTTVENKLNDMAEHGDLVTTVNHDSTLSGNGTIQQPLGVLGSFADKSDFDALSDKVDAIDFTYTSPYGTSLINNDNHTIEQSNSAIGQFVTKDWKTHGQAAVTASNPWEGSSLGGQTPRVTEVGWTIWDNAIIDSDAYIKLSCGQESMNVPLKTTNKYHSHYFPSATMPENWVGKTVWETYYGPTTTQQITTYRRDGNETVTSGVRELAWKDDLDSAKTAIAKNTVDITNVTNLANTTDQYIKDNESKWGATLNVNSPLSGNGSTTSPLGIKPLMIDSNTLSGDGYTSNIGLNKSYALASDLATTNATVVGHSDDIYLLGNNLYECQQDIESVSAMVPEIRWTGMGSASADKLNFTQQFDPVTEEYVSMDYETTARGLGYTLSDAGRIKLTNAASVEDLTGKQDKLTAGYGININEINQISNTMHVETFSTILSRHTLGNTGTNDLYLGNWRLHFTHKAVSSWGGIGTNMTVKTVKDLQYGDSGEAQYHVVQNHWRQQATNKANWPAPFNAMHGKFADGEMESYNAWANDVTLGKDGYNFIYEGPDASKSTIWHFFVDCGYKWTDWIDFWVQLYYVNQNQPNSNAIHLKIYGTYHYA